MGLDKWLRTEELEKKSKKKKEPTLQAKKRKNEHIKDKPHEKQIKLTKYRLVCPNTKCKYQKTIMKKELTNDDKICPRCDKEMKVREG